MLASWRGARLEVVQVLREVSISHPFIRVQLSDGHGFQVLDNVLKERSAPDDVLYNRAKVFAYLI